MWSVIKVPRSTTAGIKKVLKTMESISTLVLTPPNSHNTQLLANSPSPPFTDCPPYTRWLSPPRAAPGGVSSRSFTRCAPPAWIILPLVYPVKSFLFLVTQFKRCLFH